MIQDNMALDLQHSNFIITELKELIRLEEGLVEGITSLWEPLFTQFSGLKLCTFFSLPFKILNKLT